MRPLLLFLGLTAACAGCTAPATTGTVIPRVVEIVDGDTIVVDVPGYDAEHVRLLGIDTPETIDPTRPVQCFGAEATRHLAGLIPPGTEIRLERDTQPRDRYGRLLAYVFRDSDGLFVNADMLRNGLADLSIYEPNSAYAELLRTDLLTAQTRNRGLWGACGGADVPLDPQ